MLSGHDKNYRIAFLISLTRAFLLPSVSFYVTLRFLPPLPLSLRVVLFCATALLVWTAQIQYRVYWNKREAEQLGARLAPEVRGRWPGNIDVLFRRVALDNDIPPVDIVNISRCFY